MTRIQFHRYKGILFDLDSTLTDTNGYAIRATAWVLSQCTSEPDEILGTFLLTLVENYRYETTRIASGYQYIPPYECVKNAIQTTIEIMGLDAELSLPEKGADLFKQLHLELSELIPGVERLLDSLKFKKIKLGVLTNSFEGHAKIILGRYGLLDKFDKIIDGSDVKSYKPMRETFDYALNALDIKAEESLFIGDEFFADIVGAVSIGMASIWINSRNQSLEDQLAKYGQEMVPDLVIQSLSELETYL